MITKFCEHFAKKVWQEQKPKWIKQSEKLQNGGKEEKALSQQIKTSIKGIDNKFQQVKQSSRPDNSQTKFMNEDLPWIIGGGIMLLSFGYYFGWLFTKESKKKKKNNYLDKEITIKKSNKNG